MPAVTIGTKKRRSVIDLRNNHPEKFGYFIMALKNLINSDDWARICGIHGNTFKPGDKGVKCPTDKDTVTRLGLTGEPFYCKHSVYSFIAWHTPYVYQFELLLNKYNKSSNSDYITLPWLDLTETSVDFSFLNDPEITIFYDKKRITTENPLSGAYYYVDGVRCRTTRGGFFNATTKKQKQQIAVVKKQLNNALYAVNYEQFSSVPTKYKPSNVVVDYIPLETPHNSLHDIIGGASGNMSNIDVAAFDPIFWLHHCNMDRHWYTWAYNATAGFNKPLYPALMSDAVHDEMCAPFSKEYVYANDARNYNWGFDNGSGQYMKVRDTLALNKFPYTYDIIKPAPMQPLKAFVELIDIPIPRESVVFNVYIYPNLDGGVLDRELHYAGSAFWFGVNRDVIDCCRCNVGFTNVKIDIETYVAEKGITSANLSDYTVLLEGEGSLIKGATGAYQTYSMAELIKGGSYSVVIN